VERARQGRGSSWAEDPAYPAFVTVGCANFATVPFDLRATLAKMEAVIRDAHRQGCQLVAFPEHAVNSSGRSDDPEIQARIDRWHIDEAELLPGPTTEFVARLAAELDIYVVFGMAERDPDHADRIYNAAAIVGPEGILGTYRKLHLGHPSETPCGSRPARSCPCGRRSSDRSGC
jgi:predicted amidohydrolase